MLLVVLSLNFTKLSDEKSKIFAFLNEKVLIKMEFKNLQYEKNYKTTNSSDFFKRLFHNLLTTFLYDFILMEFKTLFLEFCSTSNLTYFKLIFITLLVIYSEIFY